MPHSSKSIKTGILGFELIEDNLKEDNKKITGNLLDKIFSNYKDYLKNVFKEYSDLNFKKTKQNISVITRKI